MAYEALKKAFGTVGLVVPSDDELDRAVRARILEQVSPVERAALRAVEALTLDFAQPYLPAPRGAADWVGEIAGQMLGTAPAALAAYFTGGLAAAPLAARLGLGTLGRVALQEGLAGALTGLAYAPAELRMSAGAGEVAAQVAEQGAIGAALPLAGRAVAGAVRALRGARQAERAAERAIVPTSPVESPPLESRLDEEAMERALQAYLEDYRRFLEQQRDVLAQEWHEQRERALGRLGEIIQQIRPEVERRLRLGTLRPSTRKPDTVRWLAERIAELDGGDPSEIARQLRRKTQARFEEILRDVESRLGGVTPENVARVVAREQGIDLGAEFRAVAEAEEPLRPEQMIERLVETERLAVISGAKEMPRGYLTGQVGGDAEPVRKAVLRAALGFQDEPPYVPGGQGDLLGVLYHRAPDVETARAAERVMKAEQAARQAAGTQAERVGRAVLVMSQASPMDPAGMPPAAWGQLRAFLNRAFSGVDAILRAAGPRGQALVAQLRLADQESARLRGRWYDMARPFFAAPERVRHEVVQVLEGEAQPSSEKVRQIAGQVRALLDDAEREMAAAGRPLPRLENYFPRLWDWDAITTRGYLGLGSAAGFRREVLEALVRAGVARDVDQAAAILSRVGRRPSLRDPVAWFEREREIPVVPPELERFLLPPEQRLAAYIEAASQRIGLSKVFGPDQAGLRQALTENSELAAALGPEMAALVRSAVEAKLGLHDPVPSAAWVVRLLANLNTATLMTMAAIPNVTQGPLAVALRYGMKTLLRSLTDYLRLPREELERFALQAGAVFDTRGIARALGAGDGPMSGPASMVLRLGGFLWTERFNQIIATRAARLAVDDYFQILKGGSRLPEWFRRFVGLDERRLREHFARAGVDINEALRRGYLTEDEYLKVAYEFNRATQFPRPDLELPAWTNHPLGQLVSQFRRFVYIQTKLIRDEVLREARRGNLRPLLVLATVFPAAGYLVGSIRDWLSGRDRSARLAWESYLDALSWVGATGIFEEILRVIRDPDPVSMASLIAGPSSRYFNELLVPMLGGLGRAVEGLRAGSEQDAAQGTARAARALIRTFVPSPLGRRITDEDHPLIPALAPALQGVPEAEYLRTRAQRLRNRSLEEVGEAWIRLQVSALRGKPDYRPLAEAVRRARERGIVLTVGEMREHLDNRKFLVRLYRELARAAPDAQRRALFNTIRYRLEREMAEERMERLPESARPLLQPEAVR